MDVVNTVLGISGFFDLIGMLLSLALGIVAVCLFFVFIGLIFGFIARFWRVFLILFIVAAVIYVVVGAIDIFPLLLWLIPILCLGYLIIYFGVIGYIFGILARSWKEIVVSVVLCYIAAFVFGCDFSVYPLLIGLVIGVLVNWSEQNATSRNAGRN